MLSASSASTSAATSFVRVIAFLLAALLSPSASLSVLAAAPIDGSTQPPVEAPPEFPEPAPLLYPTDGSDVGEAETANYSDGDISIDYPVTWEVEVDESGNVAIANMPTAPSDSVETQIFRVASPPGPLVDANIDSFIEEGSAVGRYRSVTIDDQSALVIWLSERPEELSSAIATFIDYGDNTIMLFSRYDPENTAAEDSILRLHTSFSNISLPAEATMPEDTVLENTDPESLDLGDTDIEDTDIEDTDLEDTEQLAPF